MRIALWLVGLFAVAAVVALFAGSNPGTVTLYWPPLRVDLSLNLFLLLQVVLFALLYFLLRAVRATVRMPAQVAAYRQRKRERDGNKGLREALKALFEGRFGHAEKAALRAAELDENAGLAALIGARAAHRILKQLNRKQRKSVAGRAARARAGAGARARAA